VTSVLRGHREGETTESGPFTGVDVLVAATALREARSILGHDAVDTSEGAQPFPWLWLALGPAVFFAVAALLAFVVLSS
jgi:hypothetical protein